jgi:hypothetical protein
VTNTAGVLNLGSTGEINIGSNGTLSVTGGTVNVAGPAFWTSGTSTVTGGTLNYNAVNTGINGGSALTITVTGGAGVRLMEGPTRERSKAYHRSPHCQLVGLAPDDRETRGG